MILVVPVMMLGAWLIPEWSWLWPLSLGWLGGVLATRWELDEP